MLIHILLKLFYLNYFSLFQKELNIYYMNNFYSYNKKRNKKKGMTSLK